MTRNQELEIKVCNLEKRVVSLQEKEKFWRELYLASNRNENMRDSIVFEDFNSPMKTERKENVKPKVEADMKVKIVKARQDADKPKTLTMKLATFKLTNVQADILHTDPFDIHCQ